MHGRIINDALRNDEPASVLYFLDKKKNCEKLTGPPQKKKKLVLIKRNLIKVLAFISKKSKWNLELGNKLEKREQSLFI